MSLKSALTELWLMKIQLGSKYISTTKVGRETEAGGCQFEMTKLASTSLHLIPFRGLIRESRTSNALPLAQARIIPPTSESNVVRPMVEEIIRVHLDYIHCYGKCCRGCGDTTEVLSLFASVSLGGPRSSCVEIGTSENAASLSQQYSTQGPASRCKTCLLEMNRMDAQPLLLLNTQDHQATRTLSVSSGPLQASYGESLLLGLFL